MSSTSQTRKSIWTDHHVPKIIGWAITKLVNWVDGDTSLPLWVWRLYEAYRDQCEVPRQREYTTFLVDDEMMNVSYRYQTEVMDFLRGQLPTTQYVVRSGYRGAVRISEAVRPHSVAELSVAEVEAIAAGLQAAPVSENMQRLLDEHAWHVAGLGRAAGSWSFPYQPSDTRQLESQPKLIEPSKRAVYIRKEQDK